MRRWYGNLGTVVNLKNNGEAIASTSSSYSLCNPELYFKSGIAWTRVSSGKFATRFVPNGVLFEHSGPVIFCNEIQLSAALAYLNSSCVQSFLALLAPTLDYGATPLRQLPVAEIVHPLIVEITNNNIELSRADWNSQEISWEFQRNPLL